MGALLSLSFGLGQRSARLKPRGPLQPPAYSPIRDGGDESHSAFILPIAKRSGGGPPKVVEGLLDRAENAARTVRFRNAFAPARC
jgi:hypothetical protein